MRSLNLPANVDSSALRVEIENLKCNLLHYNAELYAEGDEADLENVESMIAAFDLAAGVFADAAKRFEGAIQNHLDTTAQAAGYDNMLSASSYAGFANSFQVESQNFIAWRGSVWDYAYAELAKVQAGTRIVPTIDEFIAELPAQ